MSSSLLGTNKSLKLVKNDFTVVTATKQTFQINQGLLFNRWVPPSVVLNNDTYVIDSTNYESEYKLCHQQDIIKGNNFNHKYKFIQEILLNSTNEFTKFDFTFNKGFHIFENITGVLYECRILYAYYHDKSDNIRDIKWRVFVDQLKINIIMSTYMIKKVLLNNYSDKIMQMSISNDLLINESKKKKSQVTVKKQNNKNAKSK